MKAYTSFNTKTTPQSQPIPGKNQIANNAGGYVFGLDTFKQFERFLIMGSDGGSYYVRSEKELTADNAKAAIAAIAEDGHRAVDLIVAVSDVGRAPKNDPALFALALAASSENPETRAYALGKLSQVARIPTHLYHFNTYVSQFRGRGRSLSTANKNWLATKEVNNLAYQCVKYQQRDGMSMDDILRLYHPETNDPQRQALYRWITDGVSGVISPKVAGTKAKGKPDRNYPKLDIKDLPPIIAGFERAKDAPKKELVQLIRDYNLSREMLPTEALKEPEIWEALLEKMPPTALLRNLGNLSKCGLLKPLSEAEKTVIGKLSSYSHFQQQRVHPVAVLMALKTYSSGHGLKGSGAWTVVPKVVDQLNDLFYECFKFLEPTGKRFLIGVDVSGSMTWEVGGMPITCAEGAGAIAMAIARTEPECFVHGFAQTFRNLGITPKMRLDAVLKTMVISTFGSTDCSVPWQWALKEKVNIDAVITITDNETWSGYQHPTQAVRKYRDAMGNPDARNIVLAMTSTGFTINDPSDLYGLDIAGFDSTVPQVIQEFCR